MKILLPAAACMDLPASEYKNLSVLKQSATKKSEVFELSVPNLGLYAKAPKNNSGILVKPVAPYTFIQNLGEDLKGQQTLIIHPSKHFDATPYNNLLQMTLYNGTEISICSFTCYGHSLAYIIHELICFQQSVAPTIQQLELFATRLNLVTQTFLIGQRASCLEPETAKLSLWINNLWHTHTVYQAVEAGWQPCSLKHLRQAIGAKLQQGALVWLDSFRARKHTQYIAAYLKQWQLKQEYLRSAELIHRSQALPERFTLVVVTPDTHQVEKIKRQVLGQL